LFLIHFYCTYFCQFLFVRQQHHGGGKAQTKPDPPAEQSVHHIWGQLAQLSSAEQLAILGSLQKIHAGNTGNVYEADNRVEVPDLYAYQNVNNVMGSPEMNSVMKDVPVPMSQQEEPCFFYAVPPDVDNEQIVDNGYDSNVMNESFGNTFLEIFRNLNGKRIYVKYHLPVHIFYDFVPLPYLLSCFIHSRVGVKTLLGALVKQYVTVLFMTGVTVFTKFCIFFTKFFSKTLNQLKSGVTMC
jgi:hypothetical protein